VSPVKYELGFYIPEDDIVLTLFELGFYIPEDDIVLTLFLFLKKGSNQKDIPCISNVSVLAAPSAEEGHK
jgi:hypothetical protein